jgi:hypothetical protein
MSSQVTAGARIVLLDVIGTAVFAISAVVAAIVFDGVARAQGVVIALGLFAIGTVAFLWGWWTAVQRSRTEEMAVAELYLLMGTAIPRSVARIMNAALAVQILVALGTAFARSSTDGRPGSTLAFGVLVPMFGLGLNGLWAARYGTFGPRRLKDGSVSPTDPETVTADTMPPDTPVMD